MLITPELIAVVAENVNSCSTYNAPRRVDGSLDPGTVGSENAAGVRTSRYGGAMDTNQSSSMELHVR